MPGATHVEAGARGLEDLEDRVVCQRWRGHSGDMTIEQLAIELLGLPAKARATLAQKLLDSLDDEAAGGDVDALWAEEAERRLKEVEEGRVSVRPAEAVLGEARSRLKR